MALAASADFVVLGAGAAGCAAARALADKYPEALVLLVEQGSSARAPAVMRVPALQPFLPQLRSARRFLRGYAAVPEENLGGRALSYVRGRGLGGSTLCDSMRYVRGTAAEFAAWREPQWTFDAMLPTFVALEVNARASASAVHGGAGPLAVSDAARSNTDAGLNVRFFEACEAAGVPLAEDVNGGAADGFFQLQSHVLGGERVDFFDRLIGAEQRRRPRLQVCANTVAEAVLFEGSRAVGVRLRDASGARTLRCGSVVICLGAVDSAALLLRSGVGPAGAVADLPGVGQRLIQGCAVDVVFRAQESMSALANRSLSARNVPYLWREWREYAEGRTGIFSSFAEAAAFVRSEAALPAPDLSLTFVRSAHVGWHGWRRILRSMEGVTVRIAHHYPESRGEVTLDASGQRALVRSGLLSSKRDVLAMDEGIQWVGLLLAHESGLRSVYHEDAKGNPVGPFWALHTALAHPARGLRTQRDSAAFLAECAESTGDLFGTCAMGDVVDASLRVNGLQGVHVADASVVPQPTVASSAVLGAAIGTRVADFV